MKMILKFTMLATVVILFALGCQKTSILDESGKLNPNKEFNAATAKLWYYKYFENSTQGKLNNGKKIPVWKNEFYHKVGNLEIIEFPLIMAKKQLPVPSKLSLADKKRIADASLSKIKFTKNEQGEIFVTEITYIPDMEYLQKKNFDISNAGYGKIFDDFTGIMIVKKWIGKELSINELINGKITGKKKIKNNDYAAAKPNIEQDPNFIEVDCGPGGQEWCTIEQYCDVYGDGLVTNCSDWELIPGSCYCQGGGGSGDDDPCELYGIGCGDGGGGDDPPQEDEPEAASFDFVNVYAVKISGSSGTNEDWSIETQIPISGMKFPSNRANNYYTTFGDFHSYYDNRNPAYGGINGYQLSFVYCYSTSLGGAIGVTTSSSNLIESDKKFVNTSSNVVHYPNWHNQQGQIVPFSVPYSNTKISIAEFDLQ